ncbi:MAG: basic helix-loop-helix protein [Vezdaea aestivalis]|nr:MAG: basic helix-loop-helix protein [Vezdaea aestivalis]
MAKVAVLIPDPAIESAPAKLSKTTKTPMAASKRKREAAEPESAQSSARRTKLSPPAASSQSNEFEDGQATTTLEYMAQNQASEQQNGGQLPTDATTTAAAALGMYPTISVPQPTDLAFTNPGAGNDGEGSFMDQGEPGNFPGNRGDGSFTSKPVVGSDEWHRVRRDNHKEVERRRRETINEGINELAKIVPGCEKNKGSILQRAGSYITQLKENEKKNIDKWTLEKLLTEQAITELVSNNDKLKKDLKRSWKVSDTYKAAAENAGASVPDAAEISDDEEEPVEP